MEEGYCETCGFVGDHEDGKLAKREEGWRYVDGKWTCPGCTDDWVRKEEQALADFHKKRSA